MTVIKNYISVENIRKNINDIPENFDYFSKEDNEHNKCLNNIFKNFKALSNMDIKYFEEFKDHPFWYKYATAQKDKNILNILLLGEVNIDVCQKIFETLKDKNRINFNISYKSCFLDNKYFDRNFDFFSKNNLLLLKENHINKNLILNLINSKNTALFEKFLSNGLYCNLFNELAKEKLNKVLPLFLNSKKSKPNIFYIKNASNNIKYFAYKNLFKNHLFKNNIETIIELEYDLLKDNAYKKNLFDYNYFKEILKIIIFDRGSNEVINYLKNNISNNYSDDFVYNLSKSLSIYKFEEITNCIEKRNLLKELSNEISNKDVENKNKRKI